MCQTDKTIIHHCRHRFEWPLFTLAALLTVLGFIFFISITIFKDDTVHFLEQDVISTYKTQHPEDAHLDNAAILKTVSDDDKAMLDFIKDLSLPLVLLAPLGFILLIIYSIGKMYGELRADGVRITPQQFPKVHAMWAEMAAELGLKATPDLYLKNGNGALNAFATCVPGYRRFGAIYSDILERALANDDFDSLRFILGHELGHIRLGHVYWWYALLTIVGNFPIINYFIGLPLSRAREYGCDKIGYHMAKDEQCKGLLMLAAGKHLYQKIDLEAYSAEQIDKQSLWVTLYNLHVDHPNISWRIAAIRQNRHGDLVLPTKNSQAS